MCAELWAYAKIYSYIYRSTKLVNSDIFSVYQWISLYMLLSGFLTINDMKIEWGAEITTLNFVLNFSAPVVEEAGTLSCSLYASCNLTSMVDISRSANQSIFICMSTIFFYGAVILFPRTCLSLIPTTNVLLCKAAMSTKLQENTEKVYGLDSILFPSQWCQGLSSKLSYVLITWRSVMRGMLTCCRFRALASLRCLTGRGQVLSPREAVSSKQRSKARCSNRDENHIVVAQASLRTTLYGIAYHTLNMNVVTPEQSFTSTNYIARTPLRLLISQSEQYCDGLLTLRRSDGIKKQANQTCMG